MAKRCEGVVSVVVALDHRFDDLDIERAVLESVEAEVRDARNLVGDEALAVCADADAILLGARFRFDASALLALRRCRAIVRYGIGCDNVDVLAATAAGIWVVSIPDYCIDEVAEHALSLILSLNRRLFELDQLVRGGRWGIPPGLPVRRLSSCVLGIVGFGRIGEAVGRRGHLLGMRVLAFDPLRPASQIAAAGAEPVSFEEVLRLSDFLTLHAPPSPTGPLLGAQELALVRPEAVVVNVGRADLVDQAALISALQSGALMGAAIDVPSREPLMPPDPLLELPNVVLTPHSAWYSLESVVELRTKAAAEAARVLVGERPLHPVNQLSGETSF